MRHYLLIDAKDVIHNMIVWDGKTYDPKTKAGWTPPTGLKAVPYEGVWEAGWKWDGMKPVKPAPAPINPDPPADGGMTVL